MRRISLEDEEFSLRQTRFSRHHMFQCSCLSVRNTRKLYKNCDFCCRGFESHQPPHRIPSSIKLLETALRFLSAVFVFGVPKLGISPKSVLRRPNDPNATHRQCRESELPLRLRSKRPTLAPRAVIRLMRLSKIAPIITHRAHGMQTGTFRRRDPTTQRRLLRIPPPSHIGFRQTPPAVTPIL
jgi:hypothetical protein